MFATIPTRIYLAQGVGVRKEDKNARDRASDEAGISRQNISSLTSVLPAGIKLIGRGEFAQAVQEGEIITAVNGVCQSNVPGMVVTAALALAIPHDPKEAGYIVELYETPGIDPGAMQERIEKSALQIIGDQRTGEKFAVGDLWVRGQKTYTIADKQVDIASIIATGVVPYNGDYVACLVAAVMIQ